MTLLPSSPRSRRTAVITGAAFGVSLTVTACAVSHAPTAPTIVGARQFVGIQAAGVVRPLAAAASLPAGSTKAAGAESGASAASSEDSRTGSAAGASAAAGTSASAAGGADAGATSVHAPEIYTGAPPVRAGSVLPAPDGLPALTLAADQTLPGSLDVTWPDQGQAQINVGGDTVGSYGPVTTAQPIASVTKTMTAYLILRDHPLSEGEQGPEITITAADVTAYDYDVTQDMSVVPVEAGEQISESQALQALMLPSADNIADVLAQWDTDTTTDAAFVTEMNAEAATLGMTHTQYADASGYDPGSVSTAPDLITLGQDAMANPYFANLVAQTSADIPVAGTIYNTNSLLGSYGVDGIKTGSTSQAGGCLLFNANVTVGGQPLTITGTVLGQDAPDGEELGVGLAAAKALISSTESEITTYTLVSANAAVGDIPLTGGSALTLRTASALTVVGWPGEPVTLSLTQTQSGTFLQATSSSGRLLGSVPVS